MCLVNYVWKVVIPIRKLEEHSIFRSKIKRLRKLQDLTQAEFALSLGLSRGNYSGLESGFVKPTNMLIKLLSLQYRIPETYWTDETNENLSLLDGSINPLSLIMEKYELLNDIYKEFVHNQILQLLEIQNKTQI